MVVKYKLKIVILFVLLVTQISFIVSLDAINIGEIMGLPEETKIIGIGVEDQELEDERFRITFVEEGASLNIDGNLFTNIIPQEDAGHPTYLELDENRKIVGADFTVNDLGGNYTFGNNTVYAPPNSRVFFDEDTGISIKISDGSDLTEFPNLLKYIPDGYLTTIKGKDIILPNGINLVDGKLSITKEGYFLEKGIADYNKMRVTTSEEEGGLLIANLKENLKDYEKNWIKISNEKLEVSSVKNGEVKIEVLPGNELFDTFKREYMEDENGKISKFKSGDKARGFLKDRWGFKYKIVPDEKDFLKISVEDGDIVKVESKKEKIPLITHAETFGGKTIIENGENTFILTDTLLSIEKTKRVEDKESVAFQLKTNSLPKGYQLRVGSENSFAFLEPYRSKVPVAFSSNGRIIRIHPEIETQNIIVNDKILKNHQKYIHSLIDNPSYLSLLEDGEFILPKEVMNAYGTTVDPTRLDVTGSPGFGGGYLEFNYLNTKKEKEEFIQKMRKLGLNDDDIAIYYAILTRPNTIIISSTSADKEDFFSTVLPHERMHKIFKTLSRRKNLYMRKVVNEILSKSFTIEEAKQEPDLFTARDIESAEWIQKDVRESETGREYKKESGKELEIPIDLFQTLPGSSFSAAMAPRLYWEELFTYMAGGEYEPRLEKYMKREYPKAYKIYEKIRKETFDDIEEGISQL